MSTAGAFEEKVWAQICRKAGTSVKDLNSNARGFLRRRTKKWLATRQVTGSEIEQAAQEMQRRYPQAISGNPSPCPEHMKQSRFAGSAQRGAGGAPRAATSMSQQSSSVGAPRGSKSS